MELKSLKDYLLQVSLIIVSLFIAFGVNRCNENVKDGRKLASYQTAMQEEVSREISTTENNLVDCQADIEDLTNAIAIFTGRHEEKVDRALQRMGTVMIRGVFRTFPPTTYELMAQSGDALLLDDLDLQRRLAATGAFRDDYVKQDLRRHDELVLAALGNTADYVDVFCVSRGQGPPAECVTDTPRLWAEAGTDLIPVLRHSQLRAFHLEGYLAQLEVLAEQLGRD